MLDHLGLAVSDYGRSMEFYRRALAPLGYGLVEEIQGQAGFGPPGKPLFWLQQAAPAHHDVHIAFMAADRDAVRAFYKAALTAGGRDNGEPGLREVYHPHYYGAFVLDPDGNNVEAVCHLPE